MTKPLYFVYSDEQIKYLSKADPKLGVAIRQIGPIKREVKPDLFAALTRSIVGQQISTKAQATIWQRITDKVAPFTPEALSALPVEELQSCGISTRKAHYILEMAEAVLAKQLDLEQLPNLSDEEVSAELLKLRGVGPWTAEMILIFSLQRPDVVSYGDLAIRKGMCQLYGHDELTLALFNKYRKAYSPYGTVASLYLWAIAGGALPNTPTS